MLTAWVGRHAGFSATARIRLSCYQQQVASPTQSLDSRLAALAKFYAVKEGRKPGIFRSWDECKQQVHGFSGAVFKSFDNRQQAEEFCSAGCKFVTGSNKPPKTAAKRKRKESKAAADADQAEHNVEEREAYRLEFDGASRGNPGQAGAGAVLYDDSTGEQVGQVCVPLGRTTNNVAEYTALITGLEAAKNFGVQHLKVSGDSKLVVKQLKKEWKVSHEGLIPLHARASELMQHFPKFSIEHIYREHNVVADALSNQAIDTGGWEGLLLCQESDSKAHNQGSAKRQKA